MTKRKQKGWPVWVFKLIAVLILLAIAAGGVWLDLVLTKIKWDYITGH